MKVHDTNLAVEENPHLIEFVDQYGNTHIWGIAMQTDDNATPSAPTDLSGLVKRLLSKTPNMDEGHKAMEDAAVRLAALQAEIERLGERVRRCMGQVRGTSFTSREGTEMTLQQAIEEVKNEAQVAEYEPVEFFHGGLGSDLSEAIATILNAVVKGELK